MPVQKIDVSVTSTDGSPDNMSASPSRRRRPITLALILVLIVACGVLAGRWWQARQRQQWLERASLDELAGAAARDDSDIEVFLRLGTRAREARQWARAARAYQHACEIAPDRVDAWAGWAHSMYVVGGFRPADALLTHYIESQPKVSRAYLERAALRRENERREMAWLDADKATQLDPKSGEAWALRGDLSLDQGSPATAEISFLNARDLMPDSPRPYVGLYQAYIAMKKDPEALDMARLIVQRFPQVVEGQYYLGRAMVANAHTPAEYEAARTVLMEAAANAKSFPQMDQFAVEELLGRTYFTQQHWPEARAHFERADQIMPGNPDLLFLLARTYRAMGEQALADKTMARHDTYYEDTEKKRQYLARIDENPNDTQARLELARWYARKDLPRDAAAQYDEMIARGLEVDTAKRELEVLEQRSAPP
jgi:cytochrome c-type biogenesis protein CcmH/NrfG